MSKETNLMQLTLVQQNFYSEIFDMRDSRSIMWVIEVLGYGFMGLATLSTAFIFHTGKLEAVIRWLFILNGILGIGGMVGYAIGLSMTILLGGLVVWDFIMPLSSLLLAVLFRRYQRTGSLWQPSPAA